MATETLYGNSYTTVSGITGSSNWLGAPNGSFYGAPNANTSWSARFQFPTPTNPTFASGTQRWSAYVRKGSNSGTPTVTLNLYKDGSQVSSYGPISIISIGTTKVILESALWTGQSTSGYELEVVTSAAGGSPSTRNGVELDAVEALLETVDPVPNTPPAALVRQVHTDPIRYTGGATTAQYSADQSYDIDGTIVAYQWAEDLSAGSQPGFVVWSGPTTNVSIAFGVTAPGTYNMQLTVTDDDGATDTEKFTTTFLPENQPPVIVSDSPYSTIVGEPVDIDVSASYDPDGTIVEYYLNRSAGNPDSTAPVGTGPIWTFTPTTDGTYTFYVGAVDNEDNDIDETITVNVFPGTTPTVTKYLYDGANLIPLGVTVIAT